MKTILYVLGGLFLLSKLHANQGLSVNVTAQPSNAPYPGGAGEILPGIDPYAALSLYGGEGGFGMGVPIVNPAGSGSGSSGGSSGSGSSGASSGGRQVFRPGGAGPTGLTPIRGGLVA